MTARFLTPCERGTTQARMVVDVLRIATRRYQDPIRAVQAVGRLRERTGALDTALGPSRWVEVGGRIYPRLTFCGWPSTTFERWVGGQLDALDGSRDYLATVFLGVTRRCGLHCVHCSASEELTTRDTVPIARWIEVVASLQERGLMQLHLTGGEPMARFGDVLTLLRSMRPGTDRWMNTAGTALDTVRAEALAGAGLTGVVISLDHWSDTEHDRFRGAAGTFRRAVAACLAASAAGLVVAVSLCPSAELCTEEGLSRYVALVADLGVSFVRVVEPRASGRWRGQDVGLPPDRRATLERFVDRHNADPAQSGGPSITNLDAISRRVGCLMAGDLGMYVDTTGGVHGCPFCNHPVANVFTDGLGAGVEALRARGCRSFAERGDLELWTLP